MLFPAEGGTGRGWEADALLRSPYPASMHSFWEEEMERKAGQPREAMEKEVAVH